MARDEGGVRVYGERFNQVYDGESLNYVGDLSGIRLEKAVLIRGFFSLGRWLKGAIKWVRAFNA